MWPWFDPRPEQKLERPNQSSKSYCLPVSFPLYRMTRQKWDSRIFIVDPSHQDLIMHNMWPHYAVVEWCIPQTTINNDWMQGWIFTTAAQCRAGYLRPHFIRLPLYNDNTNSSPGAPGYRRATFSFKGTVQRDFWPVLFTFIEPTYCRPPTNGLNYFRFLVKISPGFYELVDISLGMTPRRESISLGSQTLES